VCLDRQAKIHDLVSSSQAFGVNILAEQSEHISRHFARRSLDKFADVSYDLGQLGVPLLDDALASLECRVVERYPGGDHTIFIGEVVAVHQKVQEKVHAHPLLFFRSKYGRLHSETSVPSLPHM
jgi:flavin reductase (DIM6/NTAB) family NADH-FMN oxidoreductase RutF